VKVRGHLVVATVSLAAIAFLWTPLVVAVLNSFNRDALLASWEGGTLRWYREAFANDAVKSGFVTTLVIATSTSLFSIVIAVTGALWWRKASSYGRRLFDLFTYLRIILPEIVFAVSLFLLFARLRFPLGTLAVVIGHTVWNSAFATLIMQSRVITLDPALEDAAADLGANSMSVFRRVTIPSLLPAIIAALLLTFTFSFDDVVTSYFLAGSSIAPLPVVLLSMIRFRISPEINAIGILVMTVTILTMTLVYLVTSWTRRLEKGPIIPTASLADRSRGV
jgi:ABC-type spermidine/putrescine transport system permease subunit II